MKKIFTLMLGTFLAASVFASDVTISFANYGTYEVFLDGRSVSNYNYRSNVISLTNFRPGQHSIAVYRLQHNRGWNKRKAIYAANFLVRPQYDLYITVANNGNVLMNERNTRGNYDKRGGYGNKEYGRDRDHDDRNYGNHDDRDNNYGNRKYDYGNNRDNNWNNNAYHRAMNDYDFNQAVRHINSQWFGKYNAAKSVVTTNYVTTGQVVQLLQLFSSDDDRLQLAEQAYSHTVDAQNYRQVYRLLSNRSQTELNRYTRDASY